MFDSFDDDCQKRKRTREEYISCIEENDDDDEDNGIKTGSAGVFNKKHAFANFNQLVNRTFEKIFNQPIEIINSSKSSEKKNEKYSLKKQLLDLYLAENQRKDSNELFCQNLNFSTNLLEKLVEREQFNTIVLNLHSIDKGYSLGFNIKSLADENNNNIMSKKINSNHLSTINKIETKLLSYDETELLYYINSGEIPPVIIDLIDRLSINLYKDGCIIMEIRDYRRKGNASNQSINNAFEAQFVLLEPSMQTLLADLNRITNDGNFIWTQEDKYTLESQLILATAQPLCLNPSPLVSILKYKFLNHKYKLNDKRLKRTVYKFTNSYLNRSSKWNEYALPLPFHIRKIRKKYSRTNEYLHFQTNNAHESLNSKIDEKLKKEINTQSNSTSPSSFLITSLDFQSVDNWSKVQRNLNLPREDMILVKKFTKNFEKNKFTDDLTLDPIEEIILEAVDKTSKNNYSKLLIKRRNNDEIYFCQLSLCSDQTNGVLFRLGSFQDAEKYIQQYIKIFTEEGRRNISITKNMLNSSLGDKKSISLLKEFGHESAPSAFTSFSSIGKQGNNLVNGNTFQSYFNKKSSIDFNDKQLQMYQNFLYQKQQQQLQIQKQHMQTHQKQQHLHVQQQLHNQIKRVKAQNDPAKTGSLNQNLKGLIQNDSNQFAPKSNLTKIYGNSSFSRINSKSEPKKIEPMVIASTTQASSTNLNQKMTSARNSSQPISSVENVIKNNQELGGPVTASVKNQVSSSNISFSNSKNTFCKTQNGSQNFVQIYVPKIASSNSVKASTSKSQTVSLSAASDQPIKKTYTKKKASLPAVSSKSSVQTENSISKQVDNHKKKHQGSSVDSQHNINAAVISKETYQASKTMPMPNTKIINASNLNLLRKIAIDSRSIPVIVTLNSSESNDLNQQQTVQHQLKLKSQHQNKQIKLVNSRVTLKPAITNNKDLSDGSNNEGSKFNTCSNTTESSDPTIPQPNNSPIKTFQLQKSSPMLKQVSFAYNNQNINNFKTIQTTSNNSNILNTMPINNQSANSNADSSTPLLEIGLSKPLITSTSNQERSNSVKITSSG